MKNYSFQLDQLENGLSVLRVPLEVGSILSLCLANTGSRYEKPEEFGVAHFFEHMVFKGTQKYPNAQTIASLVDSLGANFNAFTAEEFTGYYIHAAAKHLPLVQNILAEMVFAPKLAQNEINKERGVILEEMRMYKDNPSSHIADLYKEMVYAGSGLGHNIVGQEKTINAINQANFQSFLHDWYDPSNLLWVCAGDKKTLNHPDFLPNLTKELNTFQIKRQPHPDLKSHWEKKFLYGQRLWVEQRQTEQAHFLFSWPSLDLHDDRLPILDLAKVVLGGNMSSRLFREVREKRGLCYYVRAYSEENHDSGQFGALAGVNLDKTEEALKVAIGEFAQIASGKKPITAEELQRAKDYLEGKIILSLEDGVATAEGFGLQQLLRGQIKTPQTQLAEIKKVTLAQLNDFVMTLIQPQQLRLGIIGPFKSRSPFEQILSTF